MSHLPNTGHEYYTVRIWETYNLKGPYKEMTHRAEDEAQAIYLWEEGNYSCNCNRGLFFSNEEVKCGEGLYTVQVLWKNTTIYSEHPDYPCLM